MAVMVTMTLKIDAATYEAAHDNLIAIAKEDGLIFHSGREVNGGIGVVDFWPSKDAFETFFNGQAAEAFKAVGVAPPDDLAFADVLTADAI